MSDDAIPIAVQPIEAIAALKAKGYVIGFDWQDVWEEEHARAFTVAKAMSRDLLEDIRASVQKALDEGTTLETFITELRPALVARGWWGRARMVDPADGVEKVVRLGSPHRLRTIYQTNLRASYMAGRWQRIQRAKRTLPFLRYVSVKDGRERPEHGAWHGTILPVDDPWWDTHFPPCGWNCRCDAQPLNTRMMQRRGYRQTPDAEIPRFPEREFRNRRTGEVTKLENGIDPGWNYNVGKASLDGLVPPPRTQRPPDDGVGSELNAVLSEDDYGPLSGFFTAFGLRDREAALAGRVFTDVAGWPLAISAGLFRSSAGSMIPVDQELAEPLAGAAMTIVAPDRIGWLWIGARDGRAMLVRRYQGPWGAVDFAARFWRWMPAESGAYARGRLVWTREDGVLAGYDLRQPRDANGKWARTAGAGARLSSGSVDAFVASAARREPGAPRADIAPVTDRAARELARLGLSGDNSKGARKMVALDRSFTAHIVSRHGKDGRGQAAITPKDLLALPALLDTGTINHGNPRQRGGVPRIHVAGKVQGRTYAASFEVRKHTIVPVSVRKKR